MLSNVIKYYKYIQDINIPNEMKLISKPFNSTIFIFIIFILYLFKVLNKKDLLTIFYGIIFCNLLKILIKRKRPYKESKTVQNLTDKEHEIFADKYSFPSGHAFTSTLLSLILISKYPKNLIYNIIPVLVGFSRVFLGVHYITDILGGFIFAFIFFKIFYKKIDI